MRSILRLAALVAAALASTPTTAFLQTAPSHPPSGDLVHVEVVVQDRNGRSIAGLRAEDFEVLDEGRRVSVEDAAVTAARPPHVFVIMIDRQGLPEAILTRARRAAVALTTHVRPGDSALVVVDGVVAAPGVRATAQDVIRIVSEVKPTPQMASHVSDLREWPQLSESEALRIAADDAATIRSATTRACSDDPSQCPAPDGERLVEQAVRGKASRLASAIRVVSARMMEQVVSVLSQLERVEGRKSVLVLSENVAADPAPAVIDQVVAAAVRANARLYTLSTSHDRVDSLAAETGGVTARSMKEVDALPQQIANDASNAYTVGYHVALPPDGRLHPIVVTVKRPNTIVRAARGYVAVRGSVATATPSPISAGAATAAAPVAAPANDTIPVIAPPRATSLDGVVVAAPSESSRLRVRPTVATNVATLAGTATADADAASGWDAYQRGDLETARARLTPVAQRPAAPSWVHYALGMANFALRYFDAAVVEWEKVQSSDPGFEPVYFDLFDAYIQTAQHDKALRLLRSAKARWPRDPDVFNALATLQGAMGRLDDAVRTLEEALAAAPADATTYFNMGKALELRYLKSRRYFGQTSSWVGNERDRDRAIQHYERYLALQGQYPDLARAALAQLRALPPAKQD